MSRDEAALKTSAQADTDTVSTATPAPRDPAGRQPRVINNPNDVANLVMNQLNHVNAKKDELTIAIKGLMDTTSQLVRAYGEHVKTIQQLQQRVKALEEGRTEK